ncbi:MAG TPA: hypothetical protein VFZ57_00075, partial [Thermoanaerobaculia bacterium]|nr:hypothetical protein [Thermoanaerobaculia bacterium]
MKGFDAARRAAFIQDLLSHLFKRPADLLPFDEVRERLRLRHVVDRGVQDVPLERIVGTLQRQREFTRAFLPRDEKLRERWEDLEGLAEGSRGFPPVELYRVGDVDFVVDGHHRVSVARVQGAPTIEARVKEFLTDVPLEQDSSIEDVILKEGLAGFLEATGLAPTSLDEFRVTAPKGYERLLEHISVHRYYRGIELARPFSWNEAVESWYETVYRPMIETIARSRILQQFADHTETDLYLFTMDHLHHLRQRYGP